MWVISESKGKKNPSHQPENGKRDLKQYEDSDTVRRGTKLPWKMEKYNQNWRNRL